jgi:20S proteasome subunit alpha 4
MYHIMDFLIALIHILLFFFFCDRTDAAHSRKRIVVARNGQSESRYDRSITTFDPSGRLLQVEYSLEASRRGESIAAALTDSGKILVLVAHPKADGTHPVATTQKVHRIDDHLWLFTAGLSGDARALASHLRSQSRQHRLSCGEAMTVKEAAQRAASVQHDLTRSGGARPLGCTAIVVGMDTPTFLETGKPRIFRTDPGGILEDCLYCCAGRDQARLMSALGESFGTLRCSNTDDAIRVFLSTNLEQAEEKDTTSYDLWVFTPKAGRRGKTDVTCFLDVGRPDSLDVILKHLRQ